MIKRFKLSVVKFLCGILTASSVFSVSSTCFASTVPERVNSLLQDIYLENPELKIREKSIRETIYNRLKIARERNYAGKVSSRHAILENASSKEDAFEKIYDSNFWGSSESKSGPGSQIKSTESVRKSLPKLIEKYDIKSILDSPCGDYNWMKTVDKKDAKYIGGDIVPKIIKENNKKYKNENTSFEVVDITSSNIPKVDLIICRDCLQHLSQENVKKALKNFKDSGSKYLLVTNYPWTLENYDIKDGDFSTLNLCQKPFGLPSKPLEKIKETSISGNCVDKYLYLYKLDDINADQMFDKEKAVNIVPIAMALDENYVYPTVVSITSAMENSNRRVKYDFHIMHPSDLSEESKKILKSLQNKYKNCSINLIDMKDKLSFARTDSRITTPAYYRLMLSDILPDTKKVIWADSDTLIFHDLSEMLNIDMEGYCYKGFLDFAGFNKRIEQKFGVEIDHYICDGVMLVNLEELRKENAVNKFCDFIYKNNDKLDKHDQTVINAVFADKIGILPAKFGIWNYFNKERIDKWCKDLISPEKYTVREMINANANPTILHCVRKPWIAPHIFIKSDKWWQYAEKTDIFDKIKSKYLIADGTYTIASALNRNKVLDITNADKKQRAKLQLWDKNNTNAQKFKVTYSKNGYYTIESVCSGKLIDVPRASKEKGTQLWQYSNNNSDAQKWYILPNGNGSYRIISKCNGMNMDIRKAKTKNGTEVQCYGSNGTDAQNFIFQKTK